MDDKYVPFAHPAFAQTADGNGEPYVHGTIGKMKKQAQSFSMLSAKSVDYYERMKKSGGNVYIDTISYEELGLITELDMKKRFLRMDEQEQMERLHREQGNVLRYAQETTEEEAEGQSVQSHIKGKVWRLNGKDTVMNRVTQWQYSKEQKDELYAMIAVGMETEDILKVFYPDTDVAKLRETRRLYRNKVS